MSEDFGRDKQIIMVQDNNSSNRADQLQFLRFCAFFLIFLWHVDRYVPYWFPHDKGALNAVVFFFILSGVVTGYSTCGKEVVFSFGATKQHLLGKIKKVYPLYFVTTLFAVAYSGLPSYIANYDYQNVWTKVSQLVKNLLLLQSWFPEGYYAYNGVGWFLSSIMFLYLLNVPLAACMTGIRKKKNWRCIVGAIFCGTVGLTVLYNYVLRGTNMEFTTYILPPSRLGEYICGLCIGYTVRSVMDKVPSGTVYKIVFSCAEIAAIALWINAMYRPMAAWHDKVVHWLLPNLLLLTVFTFGKGILSDLFKIKILRHLGDLTFECFLIHQVLIHEYILNAGVGGNSKPEKLFSLVFCLIMTLLLAEGAKRAQCRSRLNKLK